MNSQATSGNQTTSYAELKEIADNLTPGYTELRIATEMFLDHQKLRMSVDNRLRSTTVTWTSGYLDYAQQMATIEKGLSKELVKVYKRVLPPSVIEWQDATPGVGSHLLALLIGRLGHPRLALPKMWVENRDYVEGDFSTIDNPKRFLVAGDPFLRGVGQLWQYCGHGAHEQRKKGMDQEDALALGVPENKRVVHLLAESIVKQQVRTDENGDKFAIGKLGEFYLREKARYRKRTHTEPCPGGFASAGGQVRRVRCKVRAEDGKKLRYAEVGDPFQDSHINAIGLRHLGKRMLQELYDASYEPWCAVE